MDDPREGEHNTSELKASSQRLLEGIPLRAGIRAYIKYTSRSLDNTE